MRQSIFMRNMKKLWIISFVFCTAQVGLWGIAKFDLPAATPGLQSPFITQTCERYEHVRVPGTKCDLYFPTTGEQPSTPEAGWWSGARYTGSDDYKVTAWWIRVFGGNDAVNQSGIYFKVKVADTERAPYMAKMKLGWRHILRLENATPAFRRDFWNDFRCIAEDPVGRVLLYRLLIEIRRYDTVTKRGCCDTRVVLTPPVLKQRNTCRSLSVLSAAYPSFDFFNAQIRFNTDGTEIGVLKTTNGTGVKIELDRRPSDVVLFHEMLHWFHALQNETFVCSEYSGFDFAYVSRFYYGNLAELALWTTSGLQEEEISTILGIPDPFDVDQQRDMPSAVIFPLELNLISIHIKINGKKQYLPTYSSSLKGWDLSENAYICSRSERGNPGFMRMGHKYLGFIKYPELPKHIRLAHKVAVRCYLSITGRTRVNHWNLVPGEAIKP